MLTRISKYQTSLYYLLATCLLLTGPCLAENNEEPDWFQIEYIIFEHLKSDRHVLRYEDTRFTQKKDIQYSYLKEESLSPFHLKKLPTSQMTLNGTLSRLRKSRDVRVYDSAAWQQTLARDQDLPPILIMKDLSENGGQQLMGTIQIKRGRYVHAAADLFLLDFVSLPFTDLKDWLFDSQYTDWPFDWLLQPLAYESPSLTSVGQSQIPNNLSHLHQTRRIKNNEVHYLDHPALGVIFTVKNVETPYDLDDIESSLSAENFD